MSFLHRSLAVVILAVGLGCNEVPTAEEIKAEFAAYVDGANHCAATSECAIAASMVWGWLEAQARAPSSSPPANGRGRRTR